MYCKYECALFTVKRTLRLLHCIVEEPRDYGFNPGGDVPSVSQSVSQSVSSHGVKSVSVRDADEEDFETRFQGRKQEATNDVYQRDQKAEQGRINHLISLNFSRDRPLRIPDHG